MFRFGLLAKLFKEFKVMYYLPLNLLLFAAERGLRFMNMVVWKPEKNASEIYDVWYY